MALRWGYLGAGGIANLIAADFGHAGLKIQAVSTRDMARTNAFADRFNIAIYPIAATSIVPYYSELCRS